VELKLHGSIPPPETVGAGVTALGFRPDTSELLVVRTLEEGQTTCSQLVIYDVEDMVLTGW